MARLYPPSVAGTLPSCYEYPKGIVDLTIPFSMNKTVAPRELKGFRVRIKTTSTDRVIADWEVNKGAATLEDINPILTTQIPTDALRQLRVGNFYKIQIAYVDNQNITGYYSSLSIIKFTSQPTVRIADLSTSYTNLDMTAYVGEYYNEKDPNEIVYQYRFLLYNSEGAIIENSNWKIHNSYEDEASGRSRDTYVLKTALEISKTYRVQYQIITNNSLMLSSPRYMICQSDSIDPQLKIEMFAKSDYNNGCVTVTLNGEKDPITKQEKVATGTFLIQRSGSSDNYTSWVDILNFKLTGEFPSNFVFHDFTVEQGETYRYSFQQYNDYGIYSRRLYADDIYVSFEDAFLFDGKRQLRIRYNPKVASFKTTVLDSKKNTIGSKYPLFFRNGNVDYKEFSISGLITYFMDNDEFFFDKSEIGFAGWEETTDIIDANIYLERQFKLSVLDWLNNGEVKLFRSPQEGNYLVRLMNTSFAPNDTVSRMLHTFTTSATEIAEFNTENLTKYNLIQTTLEPIPEMKWRSINLSEWLENRYKEYLESPKYAGKTKEEIMNEARLSMRFHDFAEGKQVYYLKVEDANSGLVVRIGNQEIVVGATGYYEASYENGMSNLRLSSIEIDNFNDEQLNRIPDVLIPGMSGTLTYGVYSTATNTFDSVNSIKVRDLPCRQFFGPGEDLLAEWNDLRLEVQRVYYARFVAKNLEELVLPPTMTITSLNDLLNKINNYQFTSTVYYYNKNSSERYYFYYNGHYLIPIGSDETQFHNYFNQIPTQVAISKEQADYAQRYQDGIWNTLSPYYVYYTRVWDDSVPEWVYTYYTFDGKKLIRDNQAYNTEVTYHEQTFDVRLINEYYIPDLDYIPKTINIGSGVYAEIGFQYRMISYSEEQYCQSEKQAWLKAEENYRVACLGLTKAADIEAVLNDLNNPCYVFNQEEIDLYLIEPIDRKEYLERELDTLYHYVEPESGENKPDLEALKTIRDNAYIVFTTKLQELLDDTEAKMT